MIGTSRKGRRITISLALASAFFALAGTSFGGDLTPASEPGVTSSYRLEDLYDRLDTGAAGTPSTQTEPSAAPPPEGTQHTIDEIMGAAPSVDDTNGATASDVADGKTFWGLTTGEWGPQTGTATGGGGCVQALVPATGQTTCYDASGNTIACSGTGQDGDLQEGLGWPNPRFTDNTDGTVTDNLTGLIWLKNANCWGLVDWETALSNANGLADGQCGLGDGSAAGDWHLPNKNELSSLIHGGYYYPALPDTAGTGQWTSDDPFTGVVSSGYWSSTSDASYAYYAWGVTLYYGYLNCDDKTNTNCVWPVRDGQ